MADNTVNDDIVENNNQDTTTETAPQSDSDFMNDTLDYIKDTQSTRRGEDTTDDAVDEGVTTDAYGDDLSDLAGSDIPDAFSEAAAKLGMNPQEIIAFADNHTDEELIELLPFLKEPLEVNDTNDVVTDTTDKPDDTTNVNAELEAQIAERVAKQLEEKFGMSLDEINRFKASQAEQSAKQMVGTANKAFDEAAKEFPIFGKTEELPKFSAGKLAGLFIPTSPAMKARLEVSKYADAFMGLGQNIDEAMANALATYKGKHLTQTMERNLIKGLKDHETRLSGPRTGKETKKQYADSREEIIDSIRQMQRAAGVDA